MAECFVDEVLQFHLVVGGVSFRSFPRIWTDFQPGGFPFVARGLWGGVGEFLDGVVCGLWDEVYVFHGRSFPVFSCDCVIAGSFG